MKARSDRQRPIWFDAIRQTVQVIDQRLLPHRFEVVDLATVDDVVRAIAAMIVRGAPLIGVTGAYGVYLAAREAQGHPEPERCLTGLCDRIKGVRPTAVNLAWAVDRVSRRILSEPSEERAQIALDEASGIAEEEAENCRKIGQHGLSLIRELHSRKKGETVHILTHCNAGWLACIEHGTATAPIYAAREAGIDVHVWVDETRPLNQGSRLTAWELGNAGIAHTIVTDNAGGHLMQRGQVDLVIVGTDRTTGSGDVANKIGTYLKALAAKDNGIPFYVALPSSTFDWNLTDGLSEIPIEERDPDEVRWVDGLDGDRIRRVLVPPAQSPALNVAFDVTPARLVTGFVTERGICRATAADIRRLFPEMA